MCKPILTSCSRAWQASPLDEDCEAEGAVVCHSGRIKGQPGVAMDDLVYICTKLARQIDAQVPHRCCSLRPPRQLLDGLICLSTSGLGERSMIAA